MSEKFVRPVPPSQIGVSIPRLESWEKVTGKAVYTHILRVEGMLYTKLCRSTVPHAYIKSVDVSAAREVDGVVHVVTIDDIKKHIPHPYYGPAFHDQPILADGKVRYVGEPVAAVLAYDPHIAEAAAQLISVEYEELPAIYDEVEAVDSEVHVHEQLKPATTFADLKHLQDVKNTNIALDYRLRRGDFNAAYSAAKYRFEHEFRTQKVLHLSFEPCATIADFKRDHVTLHSASQGPSFVRAEIARLLNWSETQVRVLVPYLGGGYGAKTYIKLEALAVALSMIAKRPVKVAVAMDEMFYQITKHPCTFRIKSGVDEDGRIVARKCEIFWNGGAYADIGPRVSQKAGVAAAGPYKIENVWIDSYAVYTNETPSGALRGFGIPQVVWAYESHTDLIAKELGVDPAEFRRRNLLRDGDEHATGQVLEDAPIEKVMDEVLERIEWGRPFDREPSAKKRRGRGFAVSLKAVVSPTTSMAIINVSSDGSVALYHGTIDMGQGSDTAMAQMVGELLNVPAEAVRIVKRDTDVVPYDMGTLGSRSLFHMGHAISAAAKEVISKIEKMKAEVGVPPGSNLPLSELFQKKYGMRAGNIIGSGAFKPSYVSPNRETGLTPNVTPFWLTSGAAADVEVDLETGHVRILKLVNVIDAGTVINPKIVESQVSGGALMQLGFTMFEKMHMDGGQVINASLADYKIPCFHDVPENMENLWIDSYQKNGPFGAKGAGEISTFCVSPAIANAIDDAIGVRLSEMPLNAEAVYRAIRVKAGNPLEKE
jgi:CO/xanthine dehydrogenase Mo-binding subunit